MKNILKFSIAVLLTSTLATIYGCSSASLEKAKAVEDLFKTAEASAAKSQLMLALGHLDALIAEHGGETVPGAPEGLTYGDIAKLEKDRLQCESRKQSRPKFATAPLLRAEIKTALKTVDLSKLDFSITCGLAVTSPDDTHEFLSDTQAFAQNILSLRKDAQGRLITLKTRIIGEALFTEGYNDGKVRRFDIDYDDSRQEWIVDSVMVGTKAAVLSAPLSTAPEPTIARLSPAQEAQMRADFAQYTDPNGLISPDINPGINTSGNGLLYTSYYYLYLYMYGVFTATDMQNYVNTVQACRKDGIDGLYNRTPTKTDQEGPDDYIGLAASSSLWITGAPIAGYIYNYGENTHVGPFTWVFNNENPGKFTGSAWLGRLPQFVAHVQMASKHQPEEWRRLVWIASLEISKTSNPDGNQDIVLNWPMGAAVAPHMPGMRLVARSWKNRILKNYPQGGMKQVFSVYFNNPEHPLSKWALTNFPWSSSTSSNITSQNETSQNLNPRIYRGLGSGKDE